jgi:hypothetical protein
VTRKRSERVPLAYPLPTRDWFRTGRTGEGGIALWGSREWTEKTRRAANRGRRKRV